MVLSDVETIERLRLVGFNYLAGDPYSAAVYTALSGGNAATDHTGEYSVTGPYGAAGPDVLAAVLAGYGGLTVKDGQVYSRDGPVNLAGAADLVARAAAIPASALDPWRLGTTPTATATASAPSKFPFVIAAAIAAFALGGRR